ncbi:MAG: pilus (MSHA type) biogenesis protein MshL [Campylobacterota bacterium]|nr:pilus (MSHA type) biogenesis protein MshL [Campylobacterota bacterium]
MKLFKKLIFIILLTTILPMSIVADCKYELFSISSTKNTKIIDFIDQLSDECEYTIIITDASAKKILQTKLNKTHIKNLTIDEVFKIILNENNLSYSLKNNLLKISYLTTKVFSIDYILSQRKGVGNTNITLSSSATSESSGSASDSGTKIESSDEVVFWEELDLELQNILNRPEDIYKIPAPIINKNAGLITVTATNKQMHRFEKYLDKLQKKVQLQVLIDVQLITVTMNESHSKGIDWQQLYALQNAQFSLDYISKKNVTEWTDPSLITAVGDQAKNSANLLSVKTSSNINEIIKFLETQGDVSSISNPKVLTLNNQPALITAGTEYFYKVKSDSQGSGDNAVTTQSEDIQSVFAGVLLSITPEIADDRTITLKINPSLSETRQDISNETSTGRDMPPDLERRQLSSVVTVKDGNRIILGGLINTKNIMDSNGLPILGDIPLFGNLFSYENKTKQIQELVIIIEPHIIDKEKNNLSLSDIGYTGIKNDLVQTESIK